MSVVVSCTDARKHYGEIHAVDGVSSEVRRRSRGLAALVVATGVAVWFFRWE